MIVKTKAFFELIRWKNLALLAINLGIVKEFILFRNENLNLDFSLKFTLILISIILITAAGYIINDYYDIEIDKINKPEKVIISIIFSKNQALIIYIFFNILAIFIIKDERIWLIISFLAVIFSLWLYSYFLKGLPIVGNILVAILSALPLIIIANYFEYNYQIILVYSFFAFGISLIRELVKDMEDFGGDENSGLKTFPILFGIEKSKLTTKLILIVFILIFVYLIYSISSNYIFFIVIFLPLFLWLFVKLQKARFKSDFTFLSNYLKIIMVIGVISMIFV